MISGQDIVLVSSVEWGFLWQIPQEVSLRLARAGNRVLYVENMGVRAPSLRDAGRVALRLARSLGSVPSRGVRRVAPEVRVVSPLVFPPFGGPRQHAANRALLRLQIARAARRLGMRDPVIWTFLPTDAALELVRLLATPASVIVYHCTADFSQLTPRAAELARSEDALLRLSDLVFANCPPLAELCRRLNDNVHMLPPGVDLTAFPPEGSGDDARSDRLPDHDGSASARGDGRATSEGQTTRRRPVIGYVGGLHKHVDFELLAALARARPQWSWVLVGPRQTEVNGLDSLPNVRLLGQRPHGELARHINEMDVCLVPYLNNAATATVMPVKVNEYLAAGKPVVSTDLPAMREFNERHGVVITADARPDSFLGAVERALASAGDAQESERRRGVAALSEWGERLRVMSDLIEGAARRKRVGRAPAP
jgi:glycosyltransferase involved in cell wall biosynthesis